MLCFVGDVVGVVVAVVAPVALVALVVTVVVVAVVVVCVAVVDGPDAFVAVGGVAVIVGVFVVAAHRRSVLGCEIIY